MFRVTILLASFRNAYISQSTHSKNKVMSTWGWELCCVLKGAMWASTYVNKQENNAQHCWCESICIRASQASRSPDNYRSPRLNLRLISPMLTEQTKKKKRNLFWWPTKPKSMSLKFVPFLVRLFSCDMKRTSRLLPKGICPFYLVGRVLPLFAFLNCLAAQACSVCAVRNVSPRHVTAVLKLMLDFLQQIWIMLKSVLNWRGYVNNSQMGISVLSSREMQAVYGRSKCLAGPSFRH